MIVVPIQFIEHIVAIVTLIKVMFNNVADCKNGKGLVILAVEYLLFRVVKIPISNTRSSILQNSKKYAE